MAKTFRKVGLEGVRFVAPVGYFPEERILKNEFILNITVSFEVKNQTKTDDLENTLDYSDLYRICEFHFQKEAQLIETVAHHILDEIKSKYNFINYISIRINKLNPPIKGEVKNSFVELNYTS